MPLRCHTQHTGYIDLEDERARLRVRPGVAPALAELAEEDWPHPVPVQVTLEVQVAAPGFSGQWGVVLSSETGWQVGVVDGVAQVIDPAQRRVLWEPLPPFITWQRVSWQWAAQGVQLMLNARPVLTWPYPAGQQVQLRLWLASAPVDGLAAEAWLEVRALQVRALTAD